MTKHTEADAKREGPTLDAADSDGQSASMSIEHFLGKVVRENRTNQGLTIAELAEQSGL